MSAKVLDIRPMPHQFGRGLEPCEQPDPTIAAVVRVHADYPVEPVKAVRIRGINELHDPFPVCDNCPNKDRGWCGKCAFGYRVKGKSGY